MEYCYLFVLIEKFNLLLRALPDKNESVTEHFGSGILPFGSFGIQRGERIEKR